MNENLSKTIARWLLLGAASTLCCLCIPLMSVEAQPDNLERLRSCADEVADSVVHLFAPGDTLCVTVAVHPASWLIDQAMLAVAERRGNVVSSCQENGDVGLGFAINAIGIDYLPVDETDSVERRARLDLAVSLPPLKGTNGSIGRSLRSFSATLTDTVATGMLDIMEGSGYDFARGKRPPPPGSTGFWSKIVEPAIVLGATAVVVILLFSVRSQ